MTEVLIVGAGALGCYYASRFAEAGIAAVLIARGDRLDRIARDGIRLDLENQSRHTWVDVRGDCSGLGPVSAVIFSTKAGDLPAAMDLAAPVIGPGTVLLTVQNGVEAPDLVAGRFARSPILAARQHGFFQIDGDRVRHVGVAPSMLFGPLGTGHPEVAGQMLDLLDRAGIPAALSDAMVADLWEKLVLVSALGAVGTATGKAAGALRRDPVAMVQLEEAMHEVARLARRKQVPLPGDIVPRTMGFVTGFPDDARPSVQRDIEAGRSSEYDSLTGAVIRMAGDAGLDVPVHRLLDQAIRARGLLA